VDDDGADRVGTEIETEGYRVGHAIESYGDVRCGGWRPETAYRGNCGSRGNARTAGGVRSDRKS
jgi:hypothetical protein